ncbi:MFS transporter [Bdellovibrionota bacterium FG-2]
MNTTTLASPVSLSSVQRNWRWRIFASTWLCYAGMYFCRKPFYITKAALSENLGFSASTLGTIGAAYLIAYTVGQFLSAALGEKAGQRILLLSGMALSIVSNLVFGFTNSTEAFIVFMAINGLAQATGWSGTVGVMANWFRRGERGTVMGFWATNFQVGGVLANALAAYALGAYGFRYSFFLGTIVLFGIWIFFFFNQADKPEDLGLPAIVEEEGDLVASGSAQSSVASGWTRAMITNVLLIGLVYFFMKFIRYALWSWAPFFLARNFHQDGGNAGYLSTVFDLFGILGVIVTGYLSDKVFKSRRAKVSLIMILVMVASCVLMYTVGRFSVFMFSACLGLVGFSLYGPDALLSGAGAMDVGSRRHATLAAGVINGLGSLGSVVQELAIGKMYDKTGGELGPVFMLLLGASACSAIVLGIVNWRNMKGRSDV